MTSCKSTENLPSSLPPTDINAGPRSTSQTVVSQRTGVPPMTQSAAALVSASKRFPTCCPSVDKLLGGGLRKGHILEISGPPGTPKESLAVSIVKRVVDDGGEVLFVDMQNMTVPAILSREMKNSTSSSNNYEKQVRYLKLHTLPELMIFMLNLMAYLDARPKTSLLVLNSLSFPFQSSSGLSVSTRQSLFERVKPILARCSAAKNLSVVITTQLATKFLKEDGTTGNFDSNSRGIMLPSLGNAYLPSGRTYRVLISPQSRTSGMVRLLSSPTYVQGKGAMPQEAYELVGGELR